MKHEERLAKLAIFFNNKVLPFSNFVFIVTRVVMLVERLAPSSRAQWCHRSLFLISKIVKYWSWQAHVSYAKVTRKTNISIRVGSFYSKWSHGWGSCFQVFCASLLLVAHLRCSHGDAFIHVWRTCSIRFNVYKIFLNIFLNVYHEWKMICDWMKCIHWMKMEDDGSKNQFLIYNCSFQKTRS